jgi:hypothetical protein
MQGVTDLDIWAIHKHNKSVEIFDKPTSLCSESFSKAHERRKPPYALHVVAAPINRTRCWPSQPVLSAHAHKPP